MKPQNFFYCFVFSSTFLGCATPAPPKELAEARDSYKEASSGATLRLNPAGVDTARGKLAVAEDAFRKDPRSQETRDKAYLADRAARLAIAVAEQKEANAQKAEAQAELGVVAKQNLGALQKTQAEMDKAAQDRALADQRRDAELNAERMRAAELSQQQQEALEVERQARADAEQKAKAAIEELARRAAASVEEDARGTVITLSGQVLFASGKSTLLPAARDALDNVAEALKANPERKITVEGHTDNVGGTTFNEELSQSRADAVRHYLIDQGIAPDMIKARGHGESEPVATNATAEGRANNRRVEIILAPIEQ